MAFYETFERLCQEKGVTPTQVARDNGIRQSVVAMWKKRGSIPSAKTIQKLADYFYTTPRALTGTDPVELKPEHKKVLDELDENLSVLRLHINNHNEIRMLQSFQKLNDEGQQKAAERVEELTEIPRYRRKDTPPASSEGTDTTSATPPSESPEKGTGGHIQAVAVFCPNCGMRVVVEPGSGKAHCRSCGISFSVPPKVGQ